MVPSILEPLVRGPPQEAAKLNTFMREPLFSLRLNIRCKDYFFNSVSNDAVITNHITCVFCFLHAGGSHLVLINNVHCICSISWVSGWIPSLWLITNYNVVVAKYAPSSIIVMAITIAGKHGLNTQFKRIQYIGNTCSAHQWSNLSKYGMSFTGWETIVKCSGTTESSQIFKLMPRDSGVGLMGLYSLAFDKHFSFWFTELSIERIKICLMHCTRIIYL